MRVRDHHPEGLPAVELVEVVLLRGLAPQHVSDFMREAEHAPRVVVGGRDAQRAAELWRALPPGEQARCHVPSYGLRFFFSGVLVVEASVCWECNNAFGRDPDGEIHFEFDATAPTARELLQTVISFASRAGA